RQGGAGAVSARENNLSEDQESKLLTFSMFAENLRLDLEKLRSRLARMSDDNWKTGCQHHHVCEIRERAATGDKHELQPPAFWGATRRLVPQAMISLNR